MGGRDPLELFLMGQETERRPLSPGRRSGRLP